MSLQFSPYLLLYALAAVMTASLAVMSWRQKPQHGALVWAAVMVCATLWSLGVLVELAATDLYWKVRGTRLAYVGITGIVYCWGIFALVYTGRERWLNRVTLSLLAVMPAVALVMAATMEQQTFFYADIRRVMRDGLVVIDLSFGPGLWLWAFYGYIVLLLSLALIVWNAWRSPSVYRHQSTLTVFSVAIPFAANVAGTLGWIQPSYFDPAPVTFALSGVLMLIAWHRFDFLRLVPVAYDLVDQNLDSGTIITNLDGRIVRLNPAAVRILGCSPDAVGQPLAPILPAFAECQAAASLTAVRQEIEIGVPPRVYEMRCMPFHSGQGRPIGQAIILYDLTEQRKASEERTRRLLEEERNQIITSFIEKAGHEFRTPLSVIKNQQYLLERTTDPSKIARLTGVIGIQADTITHLVDDLLLISRLENADEHLNRQAYSLNSCVRAVIEAKQSQAERAGVTLVFEPDRERARAMIDHMLLALAVGELVDNAIRFSRGGQEVTVSVASSSSEHVITVSDQGAGISDDDLPLIFDRFFRKDNAHTTRGLGLGLSIARSIVEKHDGVIAVETAAQNGSRFIVTLPRVALSGEASEAFRIVARPAPARGTAASIAGSD